MEGNTYEIKENDAERRIDRILRKMFPRVPLGGIYKAIRKGRVKLNNKKVKPHTLVHTGDTLFVGPQLTTDIETKQKPPPIQSDDKSTLKQCIVYENRHILALNKTPGLLVHGDNSLEKKVKEYLYQLIPPSLSFTPGPLHRLDRNTSGLIFFSKSLKGARAVSEVFQKNGCKKYYLGLFEGIIEKETEWRDKLIRDKNQHKTYLSKDTESKTAITRVIPLLTEKRKTLALCIIHTGITHQIRAQGMIHGYPLIGDKKYGSKYPSGYTAPYILHAWGIRFYTFSRTIGRTLIFTPLTGELYKKLAILFGPTSISSTIFHIKKKISGNL